MFSSSLSVWFSYSKFPWMSFYLFSCLLMFTFLTRVTLVGRLAQVFFGDLTRLEEVQTCPLLIHNKVGYLINVIWGGWVGGWLLMLFLLILWWKKWSTPLPFPPCLWGIPHISKLLSLLPPKHSLLKEKCYFLLCAFSIISSGFPVAKAQVSQISDKFFAFSVPSLD